MENPCGRRDLAKTAAANKRRNAAPACVRLHKRVNDAWFYRLCYAFVFATGLKLLFDGLAGTFGV